MNQKTSRDNVLGVSCPWLLSILIFLFSAFPVFSNYPEIKQLSPKDPVYSLLQESIDTFYKQNNKRAYSLFIVQYITEKRWSIFGLSARLHVPYESILTLNRMENASHIPKGTTLYIPSIPGIFVPEQPQTHLEKLMLSVRKDIKSGRLYTIPFKNGKKVTYRFIPGGKLHSIERAFFLGILFQFPIESTRITSDYGYRLHPITRQKGFHQGIDIGAPLGTKVIAARNGKISKAGYNSIYGKYVEVLHEGGYKTFYGHLKEAFVELNQTVNSGMIIGEVGSSGLSTGPHLHFEIRWKDKSFNPEEMLPSAKQ